MEHLGSDNDGDQINIINWLTPDIHFAQYAYNIKKRLLLINAQQKHMVTIALCTSHV